MPWPCPVLGKDRNISTLAAFVEMESKGKRPEVVRHPRIFKSVEEGKKLLNWQIKSWADGIRDAALIHIFAAWVWQAVWGQAGLGKLNDGCFGTDSIQ